MSHDLVVDALEELPFPVGKKLLISVLRGEETDSIKRNKLNKLECYGSMAYEETELDYLIKDCLNEGVLKYEKVPGKQWTVLKTTGKRIKRKKQEFSEITESDKKLFEQFEFVLGKFNDYQKKAILSTSKKILCIAGAGTGKTTVLTERIKFLVKFKGVDPNKILAITFTKKAKEEMQERLNISVKVETFNSFCEKFLKKYNDKIYNREVSVITYGEKIKLVHQALQLQKKTFETAVELYFTESQKKSKTYEQLAATFVNDCFSILDHAKNSNEQLTDFGKDDLTKMVYLVCSYCEHAMVEQGKRDFSDQIVDCLKLFTENEELIPKYEHILVDEYQDVNAIQEVLIEKLGGENLFCVGDPRQSIFGWRGSRLSFILNFHEKHDAELIGLRENYRSSKNIVEIMNACIEHMQLPSLKSSFDEGTAELLNFESESEEHTFIVEKLKDMKETFVLARTNKTLKRVSDILASEEIGHKIKTEDGERKIGEGTVILATVHAIKGLEAERVFLIGSNSSNFPCKSSDHPIVDLLSFSYDKEEEERRLFYVGLSRAKTELYVTHTGSPTKFVIEKMNFKVPEEFKQNTLISRIQQWRAELSRKERRPAYFILHDSTLNAIAAEQPLTIEELEGISGMGPLKIQKYGETILDLIHGLR